MPESPQSQGGDSESSSGSGFLRINPLRVEAKTQELAQVRPHAKSPIVEKLPIPSKRQLESPSSSVQPTTQIIPTDREKTLEIKYASLKKKYKEEKSRREDLLVNYMELSKSLRAQNQKSPQVTFEYNTPVANPEVSSSKIKESAIWTENEWKAARDFIAANCVNGTHSLAELYPSEETYAALAREYLKVSDEKYHQFIREFKNNFTLLKRGVQLLRGKITHVCRKKVIRFLKLHKLPRNAERYINTETVDEMQNKFATECVSFWRKNWDDNNNESTWHKDGEGNIFNSDLIIQAIGMALDGHDWVLEFADTTPSKITLDQLALICYTIENVLSLPNHPELSRDNDMNVEYLRRWKTRVEREFKDASITQNSEGWYILKRLKVQKHRKNEK